MPFSIFGCHSNEIYQLFHTIYISVTNATEGYSHNSLLTCFGRTWSSSGVCRYANLLYCNACHSCMWLVIGTPQLK
jgi:hypothetical protein